MEKYHSKTFISLGASKKAKRNNDICIRIGTNNRLIKSHNSQMVYLAKGINKIIPVARDLCLTKSQQMS